MLFQVVEQQMTQDLSEALNRHGASVQNFQLLDINFPTNFTQSIQAAQVSLKKKFPRLLTVSLLPF